MIAPLLIVSVPPVVDTELASVVPVTLIRGVGAGRVVSVPVAVGSVVVVPDAELSNRC
jgi:hypothetical protein